MNASKQDIDSFSKWSSVEDPWDIINKYFSEGYLERMVRHQIESYNEFVNTQMKKTIQMFSPVTIVSDEDYDKSTGKHKLELEITLDNLNLYQPQIHENNGASKVMFPQEARQRNFTYASTMTIDVKVKIKIRNGEDLSNVQIFNKLLDGVHIGKLPVMLKSSICVLKQYKHLNHNETGECTYDAGGYFIINGSEKTVLGQERAAENRVYCFALPKNTKWSYQAELKSVPDNKSISPKQFSIMISKKANEEGYGIFVQLPRVKVPIPLFILFRCLGVVSDKEICEYIMLDIENHDTQKVLEFLKASVYDANTYITKEDAFDYLTTKVLYTPINIDYDQGVKKKVMYAKEIINNDIFPHCNSLQQKQYYLGYMTLSLIHCYFGWTLPTDRDSYLNKRIDLTGVLLNNLFRNYFNKLVKDMHKQVLREINNGSWRSTNNVLEIINQTNIYKIIKPNTIENGIKRALATGDFGLKQINNNKVGVAQVLNRLTYISSLSHLRRISTPIDKSGKLVLPRKLHNSSYGFICPAETPEGASVGIVKNLSYLTNVTIPSTSEPIYAFLQGKYVSIEECRPQELIGKVKLFVNGAWIGYCEEPIETFKALKTAKTKGIINVYVSILFNYSKKEIVVCNDSGRLTRPLLCISNNKMNINANIMSNITTNKYSWNDLILNIHNDK